MNSKESEIDEIIKSVLKKRLETAVEKMPTLREVAKVFFEHGYNACEA